MPRQRTENRCGPVTDSQIVVEVWRGAVPQVERSARYRGFSVPDEPPIVRRSRDHPVGTFLDGCAWIGSHPESDVRIADEHLSRRALLITHSGSTHLARVQNRNGTEHRRWGQAPQPITDTSGDSAGVQIALGRGNHAFIMFGGLEREIVYFVLVQVGPSPGRRGRGASSDDTPEHWPPGTSPPNARNIQRFREIYWRYLVWPPMLHPEPAMDNEFVISPAHAHADVIKWASRRGYHPPQRSTARQPLLPAWLVEQGVLAFSQHVQWRGADGELEPYLAPDERAALDLTGR